MSTLMSVGVQDESVLIASLMHDAVEDVPGYEMDTLEQEFGPVVAGYVYHVTEDMREENYIARKEGYLKVLAQGKIESILISLADKIHNTYTLREALEMTPGLRQNKSAMSHAETIYNFTLRVLDIATLHGEVGEYESAKQQLIKKLEFELQLLKGFL
jgi:(p)ppGpp synthase/HD superfamily hydrolase